MSVELRCPDCRAKLRLAEYPDPGTEIECPKCGTGFPAPDPDTGEVPDSRSRSRPAAGDRPKKKPADEPAPKPKPAAKKPGPPPVGPKRRKVKKKKTNKPLLFALVGVGVAFVAVLGFGLWWVFSRESPAVEMMQYLPEDCWTASGGNVGHIRKYPELNKKLEGVTGSLPYNSTAAALGTALGEKPADFLDYVVTGTSKSGGYAVVLRTKKDFDPAVLSKLPGARETAAEGGKYYAATLPDGGAVRAFAPTSRLVVFAAAGVPDGTLRAMMKKNAGSERTLPARAGKLATETAKGTAWVFFMLEAGDKPVTPENQNVSDPGAALNAHAVGLLQSAKGIGGKIGVGSGTVRFDVLILYPDSGAADEQYKKFKDSTLAKGDAETPPKWWSDMTRQIGSKKVEADLISNISATSSGPLFIYKSQVGTNNTMEVVNGLGTKLVGLNGVGSGGGSGNDPGRGPQVTPGGGPRRPGGP